MAGISERDMLKRLRAHHPSPAWAFLEHVANGTGRHQSRTADAIAMSLWPSRGLELHGFEVKVFRGDWLRELADPQKADEIATRCHRWWIAAAPEVVAVTELPPTWGLMVADGAAMRVVKEAPAREAAPLDHVFLAAVLRRAAKEQERTTAGALERARGRTGVDLPTDEDFRKLEARLERFLTTARRLSQDVSLRLDDLRRAERRGEPVRERFTVEG